MHYHRNNVKALTKTNTAWSVHLKAKKHTANRNKVKILHMENQIFKLNLLDVYKCIFTTI